MTTTIILLYYFMQSLALRHRVTIIIVYLSRMLDVWFIVIATQPSTTNRRLAFLRASAPVPFFSNSKPKVTRVYEHFCRYGTQGVVGTLHEKDGTATHTTRDCPRRRFTLPASNLASTAKHCSRPNFLTTTTYAQHLFATTILQTRVAE